MNPQGGWNGKADVVAKARRAKALGLKLLIDFHYSDTWADPGHQSVPAAWAGKDAAGMAAAVWPVALLGLPDVLTLLLQVPLGVTVYVLGSKLLRLDSFALILSLLQKFLRRGKEANDHG